MMRAVVTGARGFVGPYLSEHLRAEGDDVTEMDLAGPVAVDVTDADSVLAAMTDARPEVVYHLAALSHVGASWSSPGLSFRVNAEGTLHVLRACVATGVARVVVILSSEVYGTARFVPITEEHPLQGQSPYSATKIGADQIALSFFAAFGTPVAVIRPFNTYGPRQSARAVIPTVITQIAAGSRRQAPVNRNPLGFPNKS